MKLKFSVTGMTCAACSARVEKVTRSVPGVDDAQVNLMGGTMIVEAASENVQENIIRAVTEAGYGAAVFGTKAEKTVPMDEHTNETKVRIIASGAFLKERRDITEKIT